MKNAKNKNTNKSNKSNEEEVDEAYKQWAPTYDEYAKNNNIAVKKIHPIITRILKEEVKDGIGLDLGCGTGLMTQIASQYATEVIGIDRSVAMLRQARKKKSLGGKLTFQKGDMTNKFLFPNNQFDFVVSALALNHIQNSEPVYREAYRVLKSGGVFIFDEPDSTPLTPEQLANKPRPKVIDPLLKNRDKGVNTWYYRPFEKIKSDLEKIGFTIEEIVKPKYDNELKDLITNLKYHRGRIFSIIIKARKK